MPLRLGGTGGPPDAPAALPAVRAPSPPPCAWPGSHLRRPARPSPRLLLARSLAAATSSSSRALGLERPPWPPPRCTPARAPQRGPCSLEYVASSLASTSISATRALSSSILDRLALASATAASTRCHLGARGASALALALVSMALACEVICCSEALRRLKSSFSAAFCFAPPSSRVPLHVRSPHAP